jgi:hypothetical protein
MQLGSGSCSSANGSEKRRVPDAVVTVPGPPLPKRGRLARSPAVAGWLRGEANSVRGVRAQGEVGWKGGHRGGLAAAVASVASLVTGYVGTGGVWVAVGSQWVGQTWFKAGNVLKLGKNVDKIM